MKPRWLLAALLAVLLATGCAPDETGPAEPNEPPAEPTTFDDGY